MQTLKKQLLEHGLNPNIKIPVMGSEEPEFDEGTSKLTQGTSSTVNSTANVLGGLNNKETDLSDLIDMDLTSAT